MVFATVWGEIFDAIDCYYSLPQFANPRHGDLTRACTTIEPGTAVQAAKARLEVGMRSRLRQSDPQKVQLSGMDSKPLATDRETGVRSSGVNRFDDGGGRLPTAADSSAQLLKFVYT
jgi:hypothetical protein